MKVLEKILLATDFLQSSDNLITNGIGVAQTFDSRIFLVHVLPPELGNRKVQQFLEESAAGKLRSVRERIEQAGVKTGEPMLLLGNHYEKITSAAERIDANLLMIGAGEIQKGEKYQLGTTAEKIIRRSSKPVLVIKENQPFSIKTILCPVDFSRESSRALKNALVAARRFDAKLIVLSVYEEAVSLKMAPGYDAKEAFRKYEEQFNRFLEKFTWHGVSCHKEVIAGKPSVEILQAVHRYHADLLIMGTTGRTGLNRMMMGSVTERVVREVPCSFLTTKSEDVIKLQLESTIQDIEKRYEDAQQLMKDGYFDEAISEYKACLQLSETHVPSIVGIAKVYEKTGNQSAATHYRKLAREVLRRIWDEKIERDVRKHYSH